MFSSVAACCSVLQRHTLKEHSGTCIYIYISIRPQKVQNGTRAKGGLFQTLSDKILQLFSSLTSLARWGCFVQF